MTTPTITPSKSKTWVTLAGAVLTALVPYILSVSTSLPEPWPAVVGAVIAILTAVGVYKAPYVPPGAAVVPDSQAQPPPPPVGGYQNPWGA